MAIVVTGTPGTGKTTLAKALAKKHKLAYIDVSKLIKEKRIYDSYDRKRKCFVVDTKKLNRELIKIIKKNNKVVIDSHLSHYLPKKHVDLCIVVRCRNLKELKKRLIKRGYSSEKVRENLYAEIFDTCLSEAQEAGHKVIAVDTFSKNISRLLKEIKI
jgi:adenylate kinase